MSCAPPANPRATLVLAVGETFILLNHVSIWMETGCQRNDSFAGGYLARSFAPCSDALPSPTDWADRPPVITAWVPLMDATMEAGGMQVCSVSPNLYPRVSLTRAHVRTHRSSLHGIGRAGGAGARAAAAAAAQALRCQRDRTGAWSGTFIWGTSLRLLLAKWCPMFASWTTHRGRQSIRITSRRCDPRNPGSTLKPLSSHLLSVPHRHASSLLLLSSMYHIDIYLLSYPLLSFALLSSALLSYALLSLLLLSSLTQIIKPALVFCMSWCKADFAFRVAVPGAAGG